MLAQGVRNRNASPRSIICNLPRFSSARNDVPEAWYFRIYGDNLNGASTTCNFQAFDQKGNYRASFTFTASAASYSADVINLQVAAVLAGDTISLFCTLPGNGQGILRGFSAVAVN